MAAMDKIEAMDVVGTDYPMPDGICIRDQIHVTDLAHAHVQTLKQLLAGFGAVALNIGTGRSLSLRQVIADVEKVSGRKVLLREGSRRAGDPAILVADASRAKSVLCFAPHHSSMDSVAEIAWRWHNRA